MQGCRRSLNSESVTYFTTLGRKNIVDREDPIRKQELIRLIIHFANQTEGWTHKQFHSFRLRGAILDTVQRTLTAN